MALYVALLALVLLGAGVILTPRALSNAVGHDIGAADYARLAWFVTSLGTIAGALGSVLEPDDAVRDAASASSAG